VELVPGVLEVLEVMAQPVEEVVVVHGQTT
jgi:hypothetical protein